MKIVHVVPALTKGGAERVVAELANHGAAAGHHVTIVAAYKADVTLLQNYISPAVSIKFVSQAKKGKYFLLVPWLCKNRSWLLSQDVVHCHLTYGSVFGFLLHFLKKISRNKQALIIETYHSVGMAIPASHRRIHASLISRRDGLILMARDQYWDAFSKRHTHRFIRMIPNGVSIPERNKGGDSDEFRKKAGIPEDCNFIIGTIGMLRPDRQPWRYVPIFAAVAKAIGSQIHFVIAGGGPEENRVRSLIAEYKMESQIHLPGLLLNTSPAFESFDIYLSLSVGATVGVSMLEAALHKVPVVGIQLRKEYKTGPEDWVWSSTDDGEIAERLIGLVRSERDRNVLVDKQYTYVQRHYTTEAMAKAYYDFYAQARKIQAPDL